MTGTIYYIKCPIENRVIYIGATGSFSTRLRAHKSGNHKTVIGRYVKYIRSVGCYPIIGIFEEINIRHCTDHALLIREDHWIRKLRKHGAKLLNVAKNK